MIQKFVAQIHSLLTVIPSCIMIVLKK